MKAERGLIPGVGLYGLLAGGVLIVGMGMTIAIYHSALKSCRANHERFVADVRAKGEVAKAKADAETARLKKAKEAADANAKRLITDLNATRKRLRDERARRRLVPAAPAGADTVAAARACYKRDELSAALRAFTAGVEGLIDEGDDYRVIQQVARGWIRDAISSQNPPERE